MRRTLFNTTQSTSRPNKTPPKSNKDKDITDHDRKCAQDLATSLTRAGRVTRIPHVRVWARAFRDLRKINKIPERDIYASVVWYCAHVKDQYTPLVCSAEQFRTKYPAIVEAMLRHARDHPDIVVSEEAQKIVRDLSRLKWPGKVLESLPTFVQLSLDNFRKFSQNMVVLINKWTESLKHGDRNSLAAPAQSLMGRIPPTETYIRQWWEQKFPLLKKYPKTHLSTCAWSVDHKDFTNTARAWVVDYCGRDSVWDQILQEVKR